MLSICISEYYQLYLGLSVTFLSFLSIHIAFIMVQISTQRPLPAKSSLISLLILGTNPSFTNEQATFVYANKERIPWVLENLGMVAIVGAQIWWTWRVEDVFRKVRDEGNKYAMKQECVKQTKDLNDLIDLVRTDLNSLDRKKVNTLIIVDVHARDIISNFVRDSILDAREFEWESQLRFYWENDVNDIRIR